MFILKFLKNLGSAILDGFLDVVAVVICVIVAIVVLIKVNSLKADGCGVATKKPNYHRRAAIWATLSMSIGTFVSVWAYRDFLKDGSALNLFLSVFMLGLAIYMGSVAHHEFGQSRDLRLE